MQSIISEIEQKKFRPVYVLHGEEGYFTECITDAIIDNALNPEEREFNQTILYGRDTDVKDLVSATKRFPMMSPYHVVVLREAQDLKKVEELESLLANPIDTSILVLAFKKKVDMRKKWIKSLRKDCINFTSNKVPDWKLSEWVSKQSRTKGLDVDSKSASMIAEFIGGDLQRIDKDLDKLKMMTKDGQKVEPALIQKVIGVSRDYNIFELQDALMTRNAHKAQMIVKHFGADPRSHPIQPIIGALFSMYSKMIMLHAARSFSPDGAAKTLKAKPFYAKKILSAAQRYTYGHLVRNISVLRDYDLKSKGVGATSATSMGELMREMVFKLSH
ncbi:MAG: DNA polymerase III subunit delta [Flavobacteriales bacterium]|nr:DNA polymerase III subunit delta [Flavobacteriales bacterium]